MSREIPVTVHPEFKQGKPRIFSRSSSLPSRPKLKLVVETVSNPCETSKERSSKTAHENTQNTDDSSKQRKNGNIKNQQYKLWKYSLPEHFQRVQKSSEDEPCEQQNHTDRKEQRRHFFRENPFVGDLQKVFEDHYLSGSSLPVRLGRRNTYSARSLRETSPSAPEISKISLPKTSFSIPIQVEVDEKVKGGGENGEEILKENKVIEADGKIEDARHSESVQDEEKTTKEAEVDMKKDNYTLLDIDNACAVNFDKKDYFDMATSQEALGKSYFNGGGDVREEITKTNTEQFKEYIKEYTDKGDESQSEDSLAVEFSVENESKNKLLIIQSILKKAEKLEKEVLAFDESSKSKAYLAIEEKLTRLLIELDGIEANRDENIRLTRKRAVQQLQRALTQLEENISCRGVQNNEDKDWSLGMNRCESI